MLWLYCGGSAARTPQSVSESSRDLRSIRAQWASQAERLAFAVKSAKDRATAKAGSDCWRLHPRSRKELDETFSGVATARSAPLATDSVLPRELFDSTRGHLEKVVYQLNASYDNGLFDCCAVMCRRVLETLLIEVYEAAGRAAKIKDSDGHFLMFAGLLGHFEKDATYHPGRNTLKGLRDFKSLGDLSAHNRRFNARKDDIDRVRDGLRVAAEELLSLAGLTSELNQRSGHS